VTYANLVLQKSIPFGQGYQLLWVKVNQVLVPAQINLVGNNLYCQWLNETQDEKSSLDDVFLCHGQTTINFGDLQVGVPKTKILRITNINSTPINIKQFAKLQVDELSIDLLKMTDIKGD
jgi:hypothetical protein